MPVCFTGTSSKIMTITRRNFLSQSASTLALSATTAFAKKSPCILLRSSWQVVNIGDIAHTPGVLALLEKYLPDAEVRLWASPDLSAEVMAMEHRRFPKLPIIKGSIDEKGKASNPELQAALSWCDFLLHGSGPSLVASKDVAAFIKHTGKPFGVYGITHGSFQSGTNDRELLTQAKFVFFRDSPSLQLAQREGVKAPVMEFAPDGAFACDLRDDAKATAFLQANQLEAGKFLCCIPRLRYTPYWKIRNQPLNAEREARNQAMAEHDHAPLRAAITAVIRETKHKVLLCPEDMTQMEVGKQWVYDKLPEDVKSRVVWREKFWLTDEALSVYIRSAGLFGLEMHSPIMAVGNGIPAIVGRFAEQTSKGFMWRDIGLGEWLFDFDQDAEIANYVPAVLAMAKNPAAAKAKLAQARRFVQQRQRDTMQILRRELDRL
ncbi:MAG: polysaccharide pyruvyl transferase family protein [Blastocatellia bacterium]|nr:polysaccharide pyruvyl transferase family protein [Blastocatellia bacterium]